VAHTLAADRIPVEVVLEGRQVDHIQVAGHIQVEVALEVRLADHIQVDLDFPVEVPGGLDFSKLKAGADAALELDAQEA
jgi:hypothetical protein